MAERRRWGRPGEQLPAATAEGRRRQLREATKREAIRGRMLAADQEAQRRWEAGLVVPHFITMALDAQGLYGPEVDEACGAHEPDVDRWEAGELYPSWPQLCALAELTGVTPAWFVRPSEDRVDYEWTSAPFHEKNWKPPPAPILEFKRTARDAMVQGRLW